MILNPFKSLLRCLDSYCRSADVVAFGLAGTRSREAKIIRTELRRLKDLRVKGSSVFYFDKELVVTAVGTNFLEQTALAVAAMSKL